MCRVSQTLLYSITSFAVSIGSYGSDRLAMPSSSPFLGMVSLSMCYAAQPRRAGRVTLCFCFLRRSLEERSELTNVGALKIAETLEQHDATAKQSVITFR